MDFVANRSVAAGCALVVALLWGCSRAPIGAICPRLGPGDLVVSEIRGAQAEKGLDVYGQWIELYNHGTDELALAGLSLRIRQANGTVIGDGRDVVVRDRALRLAPGAYAVIGRFVDAERPPWVDFGYLESPDDDAPLPDVGIVEVLACGALIDQAAWDGVVSGGARQTGLPPRGTLILDGARDPDADDNGVTGRWCYDDRQPGEDGGAGMSAPGTPRQKNPSCP